MKRLICTDTHTGLYNDSDIWLDIVLNYYKNVVKYCILNNINQIIHLGDFFHNRKALNTKTQHVSHRIANILGKPKDLHTFIIVGNHDCYYKNQVRPNTLELFQKYTHITIVDEITKLDDILLVPWGVIPESTEEAKYCFGHFAINGFHMNDTYKCKKGIDVLRFKDFDMVLSGHFHAPSKSDNVVYIGAPYGQDFNDAGGIRGFSIFEDGKLDFVEYEEAPKFIKVSSASDFGGDIEGNIARLIFDKDYGTTKNQEIVDKFLTFNPLLYSIDFANIEVNDPDYENDGNIIIESKEKIIDSYIDNQLFSSNIKIPTLKSMFKKIMKEVGEEKSKIRLSNSNKIECISIGFQNFLSFGSSWQEIEFKKGMNFVTGFDEDKNKSNGAGKSSFLEAIPFALFGKTAREIKQDQIINWKNKKNCKVSFKFKLDEDLYEIVRQLKPNNLEIFKNGELIDKNAHKSDYQSMFEDIFGIDFKMFMSIIHSNVNNSANILSMKKDEKRKFLERMFGLEIYSEMNKSCNTKLRDVDQKKYKIEIEMNSSDDKIKSYRELINKFNEEIENKKYPESNIKDMKDRIEALKNSNPNIDTLIDSTLPEELANFKNVYSEEKLQYETKKISEEGKITSIDKEINRINGLEEIRKKNEEIKSRINRIVEKSGDVDLISMNIESAELEIEDSSRLLEDVNKESMDIYKDIADSQAELKKNEESLLLLADGKCPTCGQNVEESLKYTKKSSTAIKRKLTILQKKYDKLNIEAKKHQEMISECSNRVKTLHTVKDKLNGLRSEIKDVEYDKDKTSLVNEKNLLIKTMEERKREFNEYCEYYLKEVKRIEAEKVGLIAIRDEIRNKEREYDLAVNREKEAKAHIESLKKMIEDQEEKVRKENDKVSEFRRNENKLNDLIDYLNAIKFILKDENIKQYTIKKIMPFINKQSNHYLSEVNYSFYINVDKWLDVEIKGPGIRNATYNSLSGGERRGIDLAIQQSLLDVAQVQLGCFPDILIFDELLDSSIDGVGMDQILRIIKTKQKENDSKVFVISHRTEVDYELIDNNYNVTKKNGFSKVNV